jgi:uncharacterized protein (DUF1778 family)
MSRTSNDLAIVRPLAVQYAMAQISRRKTPSRPGVRNARLEARLPLHVHSAIKRAATLQGRSVSDFVVAAAQEAAQRAITETEIIRLSLDDQRRFANALLSPPKPSPALKRAIKRHKALVHVD